MYEPGWFPGRFRWHFGAFAGHMILVAKLNLMERQSHGARGPHNARGQHSQQSVLRQSGHAKANTSSYVVTFGEPSIWTSRTVSRTVGSTARGSVPRKQQSIGFSSVTTYCNVARISVKNTLLGPYRYQAKIPAGSNEIAFSSAWAVYSCANTSDDKSQSAIPIVCTFFFVLPETSALRFATVAVPISFAIPHSETTTY
ncbi:hypothetical protein BCR34DRAFT_591880 [Clohesyomyces aquaticus]|uniref:Uncharacterized protein n=1 Tax=Clohesyomyces aquaticus TaxID=1231657 RepID=A0A1Y1YXG7_9PLEO|nr:hypothetical protein BCR34DRAFT_591880 [Clohesyomyces aquaticus]